LARLIVFSTCKNKKEAKKIAEELVKRKYAACVNLLPVTSVFRWKGTVHRGAEWLLLIKSRSEVFSKLEECILSLHSYEMPEIIAFRIHDGLPSYLTWIDRETSAIT